MFLGARVDAERWSTAISMGILGGVLGLSFGVGGGLAGGSNPGAARAGLFGLLLGAAAGMAASWVLVPVFYRSLGRPPNPMLPLVIHTGLYAAIGSTAGLAFGLGLMGRWGAVRGLLAGFMGAVLGSVAFNVLHTYAFPLEWDFSPMPGRSLSRLLAHLCVAVLAVLCVVLVVIEHHKPASATSVGLSTGNGNARALSGPKQ
jgi:hypothetical protein